MHVAAFLVSGAACLWLCWMEGSESGNPLCRDLQLAPRPLISKALGSLYLGISEFRKGNSIARWILQDDNLRPWETLNRRVLLDHSKFLKVEGHDVRLPNGEVIRDWPWVIIPDAAIVLAQDIGEKYLCFRQTKYAVDGISLAPVGGMVAPGEVPLSAAKRELLEETGYEAKEWIELGSYAVDPNRGGGIVNLFFARSAQQVAQPDSDDLEDQSLILLSRDELISSLMAGEFKVLSWAAGISMALMHENSI